MKTIKGLMIKDLLQLKSYKKTLLVFMFVFIASAMAQEHTRNVLAIMITLGFGMFSIATFSYDEMAKADRYILTLPLTRKEVILAKYALVIASTVIGAIFGILITILLNYAIQKQIPDIGEIIGVGIGGIFGVGTVQAIQIPCIYKFGAEKGRLQVFIFVLIFAFILGGIVFIGEKMGLDTTNNYFLNNMIKFLPIFLLAMTMLIYYISYKIAYKIYRNSSF